MSTTPVTVCIACGADQSGATRLDEENLSLRTCPTCGTSETFPKPDLATLEAQYSAASYGPGNVKFVPAVEALVARITRKRAACVHALMGGQGRILEIGCGRGLLLRDLAQLGHECYGIERSALAARRATQTEELRVYTQPLEDCHFPGQYFDAVIVWHVLEHLDHPQGTLALISRVLKPGGLLYLEVPNLSSLQSCSTGKNWFHLDLEHHLYHFTMNGLHGLLLSTGFRVEKTTTWSLEQGPYGVLQSWLNVIGGEQGQFYRILKREISPALGVKLWQFALAGTLAVPSLFFALIEAAIGRGGVLRVVARSGSTRSSL
ncbi:MAG: class I SAM-dependent methyltransferase [Terriglobia bacterium]